MDNFIYIIDKYKQIGNAVPPLFAEALAKSIRKNLDDIEL